MKVGDLVVMPDREGVCLLRNDLTSGIVIDDKVVRNRIGILWADGYGQIDFEPVKWLKVISKIP